MRNQHGTNCFVRRGQKGKKHSTAQFVHRNVQRTLFGQFRQFHRDGCGIWGRKTQEAGKRCFRQVSLGFRFRHFSFKDYPNIGFSRLMRPASATCAQGTKLYKVCRLSQALMLRGSSLKTVTGEDWIRLQNSVFCARMKVFHIRFGQKYKIFRQRYFGWRGFSPLPF